MQRTILAFGTVALLSIEKKFLSLIARHLEVHIIQKNRLINPSIPKGSMPKVHQCWDSMSLVWHDLKAEKSNKISIAAIWFDNENAYVSILYQSIYHALKHYGIGCPSLDLLTSYYNGLCSTFFSTK